MIKKIVFFNLFHKGDLHSSRSLVRFVCEFAKNNNIQCEYVNNFNFILKDIDIKYSNYKIDPTTPTFEKDGVLYFNTWFASDKEIFNEYSVSFDTVYLLFDKVMRQYFGVGLPKDYWSLFPEIDYTKVQTKNIDSFVSTNTNRLVLLCNCDALSGQSDNFSLNPVIEKMALRYTDTTFLVTNNTSFSSLSSLKNIVFTSSIIGHVPDCDLNENAYLSNFCDAIIGRYSGAYTFSINRTNYQRKVKMLALCNKYQNHAFIKSVPIQPVAEIFACDEVNTDKVFDFFSGHI